MAERVIERAAAIQRGEEVSHARSKFASYAISNFRGGIGKSTLSFNLAYDLSAKSSLLLFDLCPQRNMTQSILGEDLSAFELTIYDALLSELTGTRKVDPEDIIMRVSANNPSFLGSDRKRSYMVPGSQELFLFPSLLYSQLAQYGQLRDRGVEPMAKVLTSIKTIIEECVEKANVNKVLLDTSPFFGGATHLSWCAAEALIIPVRVDQHSIEALRLTLEMLTKQESEFHTFNKQAGLTHTPKVHAVVMTHCGWSRQNKNNPDSSTRFFLQKALEIAEKHKAVFSDADISNCFYLLDDFLSSGRISGKQRIPLAKLTAGKKYMVDGQRLEVNPSVGRYKLEMKSLAAAL